MPSYLDFTSTKRFRDFLIAKTLNSPDGPQTFNEGSYIHSNQSDLPNLDPGDVDDNRSSDLSVPTGTNVFKPLSYTVIEEFDVLQRRANLDLYWNGAPYFIPEKHSFIGILNSDSYDTESEMFKFAASTIKNDPNGPFQSRVRQNFETTTLGKVRLLDALTGNDATAINIITGREPLVEFNNKITVANTLPGKGIDFLETLAGTEFPYSQIPGDYLTNPRNTRPDRPEANTELGAIIQDVTGNVGRLFNIQRRPKPTRKPSDLMIEYLGEGQKRSLYDALRYSTYAPNYTTTARSQNTSKVSNFVDSVAQGVKSLFGFEAPNGISYIGDDRSEDVNFAMNDGFGRPVKSSYYLSLLFDPIQTRLFQRDKNLSEGGKISGNLTWLSRNSRNLLGANNSEWGLEQSNFVDTESYKYQFRPDSILGKTQDLLDSLPLNGAESRTHVANVIDQTSRIFREGDMVMSRGSAIKYVDQFGGESGVEYCRLWTKDRSYLNYSDTMKRTTNIRKYDSSVMSKPWDLNISPYVGDDFTAKNYMLSIENLAWKTSQTKGFSLNDLPVCERGPNGGRVMWFPPYDLKVSEQNSAKWDENNFIGRPEPIYTYQSTSRSGQLSFKVVVDHPSILNLLVRNYFKDMSDEESENYINAFFAGCEDLDLYELVRRFPSVKPDELETVTKYMNQGKDTASIEKAQANKSPIIEPAPNTTNEVPTEKIYTLLYPNNFPLPNGKDDLQSSQSYFNFYDYTIGADTYKQKNLDELTELLKEVYTGVTTDDSKNDRNIMLGTTEQPTNEVADVNILSNQNRLTKIINDARADYERFETDLGEIKEGIESGNVTEISLDVESTSSAAADDDYNYKLSIRRTHSIVKELIPLIGGVDPNTWDFPNAQGSALRPANLSKEYTFKELGYEGRTGKLTINSLNVGEGYKTDDGSCTEVEFKYEMGTLSDTKSLKKSSPIAFGCRRSTVKIAVTKITPEQINEEKIAEKPVIEDVTSIAPSDSEEKSQNDRVGLDAMKTIIMNTLSECHYFDKLEESDPVVFSSMKEKLKYFHPAFHSTTPEGLNSRLTFLLQCIRPGDTIAINDKGDPSAVARNTSFGPPPICVLRVGDFYHSKIVIRDVNITFEDTTWDLNPEGIGIQPMIANVQLQINFIGGQGIKTPVNKLQNALSSNFFANTEMYDDRSINTVTKIEGKDVEKFTKEFLDGLPNSGNEKLNSQNINSVNDVFEGYIGTIDNTSNTISYNSIVGSLYSSTQNYLDTYESSYNITVNKYGPILSSLLLHPQYRKITKYDYNTPSTTGQIDLFGEYNLGEDLSRFLLLLNNEIIEEINNIENISTIFGFDKILPKDKIGYINRIIKPQIINYLKVEINGMVKSKVNGIGEMRNIVIKELDSLNFVVKNGVDVSLVKQTATEATLSGFTSNLLYDEYSKCITSLINETTNIYEDLDPNTINFFRPTIDLNVLTEILPYLLFNYKIDIIQLLKTDQTIINQSLLNKMVKKLDKFFDIKPKDKNFKFKTIKRGKQRDLTFGVISQIVTTNTSLIDEIKLVKSTRQTPIKNSKLNYYNR
jgi:hypothetical protein